MEDRFEQLIMDYLNGSLSEEDRKEWDRQVELGNIDPEEVELFRSINSGMEELTDEQASEKLSDNFYKMLDEHTRAVNKTTLLDQLATSLSQLGFSRGGLQAGYSFIILLIGLSFGYLLIGKDDRSEISTLSAEVRQMKSMMMMSLLEKESPSARIKAVSLTHEMDVVDREIIEALFTTLNTDENTNVRMEALDALVRYSDQAFVRIGLIGSLEKQDRPLIQLALADIMVLLQDKKAKEALKNLLDKDELPEDVRDGIQQRLDKINI